MTINTPPKMSTQIQPNKPYRATGFTLMEMIIVIAILGILVAYAFPRYQRFIRDARLQDARSELVKTQQFLERHYAQNANFRSTTNPATYPTLPATTGRFFDIAFDTAGDCNPATLANDRYCLSARPNADYSETRYLFSDETSLLRVCTGAASAAECREF